MNPWPGCSGSGEWWDVLSSKAKALRTRFEFLESPALDLVLARGDRCCHRDSRCCCLDCKSGGGGSWRAGAGAPAGDKGKIVALKDIAPVLLKAVVATEDERFYRHDGVDLIGVPRALPYDVVHLSFAQGASTITEQVAKLLVPGRKRPFALAEARGRGGRAQARGSVQQGADPRGVPEQRLLRRGRLRRLGGEQAVLRRCARWSDDGAGEPARGSDPGALGIRPVSLTRRSRAPGRSTCCARSSATAS